MSAFSLSPAQEKAVRHDQGALLILAGPGTGKTRVIVSKILHHIEQGIAPENILALTFSRRAVGEMEERLCHEAPDLPERITVATFHAFCAELAERHGFRLGFQHRLEIITEAQSQVLFKRLALRLPLQPFLKTSNFDPVMHDLLAFFQMAKDEGLWPENILRAAREMPETSPEEAALKKEFLALGDLYNAYQSLCFEEGFMDFGDAILLALKLLETEAIVRAEMHERYRVILVDEFQDTNWTQIQLLRHLAGPQAHCAVVGDDDQSIYKFRGASYAAFTFFEEAFGAVEKVQLEETYRLPPAIAEAASRLIRANGRARFRPDKILKSLAAPGPAVSIWQSSSFEDEAYHIAEALEAHCREGVSPAQLAVLVRAHGHGDILTEELKKRNLPLASQRNSKFFRRPLVLDGFALLELVVEPKASIALMRVLDSPYLGLSADEIFTLLHWMKARGSIEISTLADVSEAPLPQSALGSLSEFYSTWRVAVTHAARKGPADILEYFCAPAVQRLLKTEGDDLNDWASLLRQLRTWELLQEKQDLHSLYPLLSSLADLEEPLSEEDGGPTEGIRLISVHASKGLEFEHVYILSLCSRRFPSIMKRPLWSLPTHLRKEQPLSAELHLQEERRLLYVGMTRAKKTLTLSTIEKKGTRPSVFITQDLTSPGEGNNFLGPRQLPPRPLAPTIASAHKAPFERVAQTILGPEKLLESLRLSFTQLDRYESCPLAYRFEYVLRIPPPPSPSLATGSAVHKALELFFRRIQNDERPGEEILLRYFEDAFNEEKKRAPNLPETDRELGQRKLKEFYIAHGGKFPKPLELEKSFSLRVGSHTLRGKIDRVDRGENGGVHIIDYKTGRARSSTDADDQKFADESLQLSIYALAAEEVLGWRVEKLSLYYVYENSVLSSERSSEKLKETRTQLENIANKMASGSYDPKPGYHCLWCSYQKICPAAERR